MKNLLKSYAEWLHTRWPAGTVEALPEVGEGGKTNLPEVRVVGDLAGVPLLKFASESAARAVREILAEPDFRSGRGVFSEGEMVDVAILGAGVAGISAAIECAKAGLRYVIYESAQPLATLAQFPKGKPIYTYPREMKPTGGLQYEGETDTKEKLLELLREQMKAQGIVPVLSRVEKLVRRSGWVEVHHGGGEVTRARRVIVAIGRCGDFRRLGIPGEDLEKVSSRLHDPKDYAGKDVLVVGGGDSALEAALALAEAGARVTLCHRGSDFARAKAENAVKVREWADQGRLEVAMRTVPVLIGPTSVRLNDLGRGEEREVANDVVFTMIGREAPLEFFRRSGLRVRGDRGAGFWWSLAGVLLVFTLIYQWKKGGTWLPVAEFFRERGWFPFQVGEWWAGQFRDPATLVGTMSYVAGDPGFYYSALYTLVIVVFGWRRVRRRGTPYVTRQTLVLMGVQVVPLFLLPYILLPWAGFNGWFDGGWGKAVADELFPVVDYGSGREYWRAFGLILAWPLFIWNVFTNQPMWGWLAISVVQTLVVIPLLVWRWGKGAYCGWICSCGAMAETLGDTLRQKMPHGPVWNRLNMIGQFFLAVAVVLLVLRVGGWIWPGSAAEVAHRWGLNGSLGGTLKPWGYAWFVDLLWAGILGMGMYFHFSGRVWCRFACPLAALMHIYARFTRFRIFAEKSKCISCNVCTSVCHQGIDVMNFANKGLPMEDPQCVRCSACVQQCPTGVLGFGRLGRGGKVVLDGLEASPVRMREKR